MTTIGTGGYSAATTIDIRVSQYDARSIEEAMDHAREMLLSLGALSLIEGLAAAREALGLRRATGTQWMVAVQCLRGLADAAERLDSLRAADLRALAARIHATPVVVTDEIVDCPSRGKPAVSHLSADDPARQPGPCVPGADGWCTVCGGYAPGWVRDDADGARRNTQPTA